MVKKPRNRVDIENYTVNAPNFNGCNRNKLVEDCIKVKQVKLGAIRNFKKELQSHEKRLGIPIRSATDIQLR